MAETPEPGTDPDLERRWAAIEPTLAAASEDLARQGTLVRKATTAGRAVWAVRYVDRAGARPVHRSVYLGDHPELVRRAGLWLERYRGQRRQLEEIGAYARLVAAIVPRARRLTRRE